ncbi:MAG: TetR/AcrR family transcriptional regulator [Candidatus Syntrophonatronum acetioxidans]|uniref:TetR/AcrR family transcriptional regulator n=1 Tax=Candidatus Syntrophonatronum acetioxidans TaxID=1795816 RepID=A0A424YDV1_9FIRM|nr:MAG: TetR/AcrR family transcriptional regulator [Candidatus Syntrophonatronum acetioxidans]
MKNPPQNNTRQDTKIRILEAAEKVFSEKGFDGSRVDEIARRAKVNKALIYYYFSSKQNLFEELIKEHLEELADYRSNFMDQDLSEDQKRENFALIYQMVKEKKDILRTIFMEMMKSGSSNTFFFEMFDQLFKDVKPRLGENNIFIEDDNKLWISLFFFVTLPLFSYAILEEKMLDAYNMDPRKAKDHFNYLMQEVCLALFSNEDQCNLTK